MCVCIYTTKNQVFLHPKGIIKEAETGIYKNLPLLYKVSSIPLK